MPAAGTEFSEPRWLSLVRAGRTKTPGRRPSPLRNARSRISRPAWPPTFRPEEPRAPVRSGNSPLRPARAPGLRRVRLAPDRGRSGFGGGRGLRDSELRFASGDTLGQLRLHYLTLGQPQRDARGRVTNGVLIMHGTAGATPVHGAAVRRGAVRARGTPRHHALLHHSSGRDRTRALEQAQRRPAHALPPLRLRRHGDRRPSPAHRAPGRFASPAGDGHLDGRHAQLGVGRDVPGLHGRADAARLPAGRDRGAQPPVARHGNGRDPERPEWKGGDYTSPPRAGCAPRSICC